VLDIVKNQKEKLESAFKTMVLKMDQCRERLPQCKDLGRPAVLFWLKYVEKLKDTIDKKAERRAADRYRGEDGYRGYYG